MQQYYPLFGGMVVLALAIFEATRRLSDKMSKLSEALATATARIDALTETVRDLKADFQWLRAAHTDERSEISAHEKRLTLVERRVVGE